jgi:hypothetical protein
MRPERSRSSLLSKPGGAGGKSLPDEPPNFRRDDVADALRDQTQSATEEQAPEGLHCGDYAEAERTSYARIEKAFKGMIQIDPRKVTLEQL